MNVCFFASDLKGFNVLKNTWRYVRTQFESSDEHHAFFHFAMTQDITLPNQVDMFQCDMSSNIDDRTDLVTVESFGGIQIPRPDWLIVSRERWQPEQTIMTEMMKKFGTKVGVVEVNSHIWNSIETWMEMYSRFKYPQSECTAFFEHSEHTALMRSIVYPPNVEKSVIVGNPRHDNVKSLYTPETLKSVREKYDLTNKKLIMVCSVINSARIEFLDTLQHLVKNIDTDKYVVVFTPYPGEPRNPRFSHQFFSALSIYGSHQGIVYPGGKFEVNISFDESETFALMAAAHCVVSPINSMFYLATTFKKPVVCLNSVVPIFKYMNDESRYLNELGLGVEDSARFWCGVHGFTSVSDWHQFITTTPYSPDITVIDKIRDESNKLYTQFKSHALMYDYDLNFLKKLETKSEYSDVLYNQSTLIPLFDEYDDGNASERIYNYLIQHS